MLNIHHTMTFSGAGGLNVAGPQTSRRRAGDRPTARRLPQRNRAWNPLPPRALCAKTQDHAAFTGSRRPPGPP
ncbi:hypothetical protein AAHH78_42530, partial [Burkholderia pseudomallei]